MAAEDDAADTATLTITIRQGCGLHGSKQPGFTLSTTAIYAGKDTVAKTDDDSSSIAISGPESCDLNLTAMFDINIESTEAVEAVANAPIELRLEELIKVEKKKKIETHVNSIGRAAIGLLPLLDGVTEFETDLTVIPAADANEESEVPMSLSVHVMLSQPLMSAPMRDSSTLLTIEASVFSLPEVPAFAAGGPSVFDLTFPIPHNGGRKMTLTSGTCISPESAAASPAGAEIKSSASESDPSVARAAEQGKLKSAEDFDFREKAETTGSRVKWSRSEIRLLTEDVTAAIRTDIPRTRIVAVEFQRFSPDSGKGGKGKGGNTGEVDRGQPGHYGMALVDVAPLLFPGATSLRGAFPLVPYSASVLADACSAVTGVKSTEAGGDEDDAAAAATATSKSKGKGKKDVSPNETAAAEAAVYKDARTYVFLNIQLTKPLVEKKSAEDIALEVSTLIPPRSIYPRNAGGGDKAVHDFKSQVIAVASQLLREYRDQESASNSAQIGHGAEVRQKLLYELNTSGKYYAYKESLKRAVVKVARDKFARTSAIADPTQRAEFLAELYRFLVDHMQESLSTEFSFAASQKPAEIEITIAHLRSFAVEAELVGDLDSASTNYQEAVARNKSSLDNWYFYGCFCLRVNDFLKADECFQECIALNQKHTGSLLLGAIVQWRLNKLDAMDVLLKGATAYEDTGATGIEKSAWAVRSLLHAVTDNSIDRDLAIGEAEKRASDTGMAQVYLDVALFLHYVSVPELFEAAVVQCSASKPSEKQQFILQLLTIRHQIKLNQLDEAEAEVTQCIASHFSDFRVRALEGHIRYLQSNHDAARQAFDHAVGLTGGDESLQHEMMLMHMPSATAIDAQYWDEHEVRVRLGEINSEAGSHAQAKAVYLGACSKTPSARVWEGVGIACYRLGQLGEAEEAFAEANIYDSSNARVWGYLALICTRTGRRIEAEQAFNHCMSRNLNDAELLAEIKAAQEEAGFGNPFVDA